VTNFGLTYMHIVHVQQYYIMIITSKEPSKTGVRKSHSHNLEVIRSGNALVTRDPHRGAFFFEIILPSGSRVIIIFFASCVGLRRPTDGGDRADRAEKRVCNNLCVLCLPNVFALIQWPAGIFTLIKYYITIL